MAGRDSKTISQTARYRGERGQPVRPRRERVAEAKRLGKVHAVQAGRLVANRTTMRGTGLSSMFRRRVDFEFPALVCILERSDGLIAIDAGMNARGWLFSLLTRRVTPSPVIEGEEEEIGPRMKVMGLDPGDVHTVILTHLDVDHVGGVRWFPNAEILVHRPEHETAFTWMGRVRYMPERWPSDFKPTLYDLDSRPYGPFPRSKALGGNDDLRLVPIPGHTLAQVGLVLQSGGIALFFTADHVLRQDWFVEEWAAGRHDGLVSLLEEAKPAARGRNQPPHSALHFGNTDRPAAGPRCGRTAPADGAADHRAADGSPRNARGRAEATSAVTRTDHTREKTTMVAFTRRNFAQPDEVMDYPGARMEVVGIDGHLAWRLTCEPGWRYSESMGPVEGSDSCPGDHLFMVITAGRLAVRMADGDQTEYGPGDIGSIPPGHESWVVGG